MGEADPKGMLQAWTTTLGLHEDVRATAHAITVRAANAFPKRTIQNLAAAAFVVAIKLHPRESRLRLASVLAVFLPIDKDTVERHYKLLHEHRDTLVVDVAFATEEDISNLAARM